MVLRGKASTGDTTGAFLPGLVLYLLLPLFLLLILLLLFLAILLLLLFPGRTGLGGLQGFFEILGRLVGLTLGIDSYLHLVLDGRLDTSLFERGFIVLWKHEGGVFLSGLPRDISVVRLAVLVF